MPFCICWANGGQDDLSYLDSIVPALSDPRYILINGKPLLIVEANVLADAARTAQRWRERAVAMGMSGLYLVTASSFDHVDPREIGFDAMVEYPMMRSISPIWVRKCLSLTQIFRAGSAAIPK